MSERRNRALSWRMHPVWRGIGFLFLILMPIIAYYLSGMLLDYLATQPLTPSANFLRSIGSENLLYLQIGLTVLLSILLYLILSILGSLLYTLLGGRENEEIVSRIGSQRRKY